MNVLEGASALLQALGFYKWEIGRREANTGVLCAPKSAQSLT
jgi:hypothetical protein